MAFWVEPVTNAACFECMGWVDHEDTEIMSDLIQAWPVIGVPKKVCLDTRNALLWYSVFAHYSAERRAVAHVPECGEAGNLIADLPDDILVRLFPSLLQKHHSHSLDEIFEIARSFQREVPSIIEARWAGEIKKCDAGNDNVK